jgi:predicted site-specific integrase-resolvase
MDGNTFVGFLRWFLVVALLSWGTILGLAQTKSAPPNKQGTAPASAPVQRWRGSQRTVTDAAGRKHVRGERISYAQRKAAAERRVKAMREAAAKKKLAEVKK